MRQLESMIAIAAFAAAAVLALGSAVWAVNVIENTGKRMIGENLDEAGLGWAEVETDGLQVILRGTAASESERFRALSVAGGIVDPARVIDQIAIQESEAVAPPRFSMEILRNDDGVSLIGLVPTEFGRDEVVEWIGAEAGGAQVTDMLDSADHPIPEGWQEAVEFGLAAMAMLPRSKISISNDHVGVTAISESSDQQRELTTRLNRERPAGVQVTLEISAPRPVITPFTLRFVIDEERGARFDACSADTEATQLRILAAGHAAGVPPQASCTIGLGVPSPNWASAAEAGIAAVAELGEGTVTFSDADVSLIVPHTVSEEAFDASIGRLDSALPEVFSLDATRLPEPEEEIETADTVREFIASLSPEGLVLLRGALTDDSMRDAVVGFSRARFGLDAVQTATRLDPDMPDGWSMRVLTALAALAELNDGLVLVREDRIEIRGRTGNRETSDIVSRLLSDRLGRGQVFRIDIAYDESLDPIAQLPTPASCVAEIGDILAERQITFAPGSTQIAGESARVVDDIAAVLRECGELALEIGGHTDSQGRVEMNEALSQQRANAVLQGLLARRVRVGEMVAVGFGPEFPIADNSTEAGREANRRIEFRLLAEIEAADELAARMMERDPELEATLEITVNMAEEDTIRPPARPAQE